MHYLKWNNTLLYILPPPALQDQVYMLSIFNCYSSLNTYLYEVQELSRPYRVTNDAETQGISNTDQNCNTLN